MAFLQRIITIWLATCVLAVPLLHVHPEADHQHGEASHFHGGLTHSVFSADLPCEYHTSSSGGAPHIASSAAHEFDHPEIGFSLLTSSPDRSVGKPALFGALFVGTSAVLVRPDLKSITADSSESAISVVPPICLSPRAPPVTV